MHSSNNNVQWPNGIVFQALNSDYNYVQMAEANAKRIKVKNPHVHITVISESEQPSPWIDHWIIVDNFQQGQTRQDQNCKTAQWRNLDKFRIYDLSPYERTIVLDCDYYVNDLSILELFNSDQDIALANQFEHLLTGRPLDIDYLSDVGIKTHWATVTYFRKTELAEWIHRRVSVIQNNWDYYQTLYHFYAPFRNDYAFSIAMHEANSGIASNEFSHPYKVSNIIGTDEFDYDGKTVWLSGHADGKDIKINITNTNFHIMDKNKSARFAIKEVLGV